MEQRFKVELKNFSLVLLFISLVSILFLFSILSRSSIDSKYSASNGILDLSELSFEDDWTVFLQGEWLFYPSLDEKLLSDERTSSVKSQPAFLPESWNNYRDNEGKRMGSSGYGIYRLKVKLPEGISSQHTISLRMLEIFSSCEVYVDGKEIFRSGVVGDSRKTSSPRFSSKVCSFHPEKEDFLLSIRVSNFYHPLGGAREAMMLGSSEHVFTQTLVAFAFQFMIFGALLIMAVYHIALFLSGGKGLQVLYLGLACLVMALRVVITGNRFVQSVWPDIPWKLVFFLDFNTVTVGFSLMWGYFVRVYNIKRILKFDYIAILIHLASGLLVALIPYRFAHFLFYPYSLMIVISFGYYIYLIGSGIRLRISGSVIQLIGAALFSILVIMDVLYEFEIHNIYRLSNASAAGMVLYIFSNIYGMSIRYTHHQRLAEAKMGELESLAAERTEELEASNRSLNRINRRLFKANATLEQLSITDHLTGLFNRQHFSALSESFDNEKSHRKAAILYIDLDNFKYYNDVFGHPLGDSILVRTATLIKSLSGKAGAVYRIGGDEFLVFCHNSKEDKVKGLASQIIESVNRQDFASEIRDLGENDKIVIPEKEISCSIGIAHWKKGKFLQLSDLVQDADRAMRQAKLSGKNRFFVGK